MLRRPIILIHRYLGIALSLLLMVWFISGIAMIYARGMPSLTSELRLERMAPIDMQKVQLSPSQAAEFVGLAESPGSVVLMTILGRPAYRFSYGPAIVAADTGDVFGQIGPNEAVAIASQFTRLPESSLHHEGVIEEADQWTIADRGQLPLHKVRADDEDHTEVYVSEQSAEVALITTRGSRALAWVAAIPHWLYFAPLRLNDGLWRQVVLWTSGLGVVLVLAGIIVGIIQYSARKPHIPYAGWMRWHYLTGIVFGVFSLTWVFSGMLSMEPFYWASGGGTGDGIPEALAGGEIDLGLFPPPDPVGWNQALEGRPAKEVEFRRIQGEPYYIVHGVEPAPLLVAAQPLETRSGPFSIDSLMQRIQEGTPEFPIAESQLLSEYDSYYYGRDPKPSLPVLLVKFEDPARTWFYVDPATSQAVARYTRRERLQRWIYHGFHSLDFSFWYDSRAWDIGMIVLLMGGAVSSSIGFFVGMKRLLRNIRRVFKSKKVVTT